MDNPQASWFIPEASETIMKTSFLDEGIVQPAKTCLLGKPNAGSAYSYLTYVTAYLKANYPVEFFCALMSVRSRTLQPKDWAVKAPDYVNEAKRFNVHISPPSVNASSLGFTIQGENVFFGFNAIRDVGITATKSILSARGDTRFKDIFDFLGRVNLSKVNSKTVIALIEAGAFDRLGYDRDELSQNAQACIDYVRDSVAYEEKKIAVLQRETEIATILPKLEQKEQLKRQIKKTGLESLTQEQLDLWREIETLRKPVPLKLGDPPIQPELTRQKTVTLSLQHLIKQSTAIGCRLGMHPVDMLRIEADRLEDLDVSSIGSRYTICGVVSSVKKIKDRRGNPMAFISIEDPSGVAEATIMAQAFKRAGDVEVGQILLLEVKVDDVDPIKLFVQKLSVVNIDE